VVTFFVRLDLDQILLFLDGHYQDLTLSPLEMVSWPSPQVCALRVTFLRTVVHSPSTLNCVPFA
jgi:hypothetical protein